MRNRKTLEEKAAIEVAYQKRKALIGKGSESLEKKVTLLREIIAELDTPKPVLHKKPRTSYAQYKDIRYKKFRARCKFSGIECNILENDYLKLIEENCRYCNKENAGGIIKPSPVAGYFLANAVPCCRSCSTMKLNLSTEEFLQHIKRIYEYNDLKNF